MKLDEIKEYHEFVPSHRLFTLSSHLTVDDISTILGFHSAIDDGYDKVEYEWTFEVNGIKGQIWDYKGARWSAWTSNEKPDILQEIFGKDNVKIDD